MQSGEVTRGGGALWRRRQPGIGRGVSHERQVIRTNRAFHPSKFAARFKAADKSRVAGGSAPVCVFSIVFASFVALLAVIRCPLAAPWEQGFPRRIFTRFRSRFMTAPGRWSAFVIERIGCCASARSPNNRFVIPGPKTPAVIRAVGGYHFQDALGRKGRLEQLSFGDVGLERLG